MLTFHSVEIEQDLSRNNPLYVGNFFSLKGMWWKKRKQRQGLILSVAVAWFRLIRQNPNAPGFLKEEVLLTNLTRQVKDAKIILEAFFNITRIGFNFNDGNKGPTLISPRQLNKKMFSAIEDIIMEVKFAPGLPPSGKKLVQSEVKVQPFIKSYVIKRLTDDCREDLIPAVSWILKQDNPITFYFQPAGNLAQRDTSVWPIKAIETWPGWLRTTLFGTVIDIENSYCQFIVSKLEEKYADNIKFFETHYADILEADRNKQKYRESLCKDILKLEINDTNISVVKKLVMALANGSNASPALMINGATRSEAVRIVLEAAPHLLPSDLIFAGKRLNKIAKQFKSAKRDLCIYLLKSKPTRINQKKIFQLYFEWERQARYKIWDLTGFTGLALHDGLDGILVDDPKTFAAKVFQKTGLKVKVEECCYV